jgi:hypothetical protein
MESSVRLWPVDVTPSGTGREWNGAFRAPATVGRYRLEVNAGPGDPGVTEFQVVAQDGRDAPVLPVFERDGLSALAASAHHGRVVPAGQLQQLPGEISALMTSNPARETWHPMRSVWWLMPFTLCAASEWWLRRHRGER